MTSTSCYDALELTHVSLNFQLQMPNIRQQGLNPSLQPSLQLSMLGQQPVVQTLPGLPSFAPLSSVPQSSLAHNQLSAPLPLPIQPRAQLPSLTQIRPPPQSAMPAQSGPSPRASIRSQPLAGPQIQGVPSHSFTPVQAPLLRHGGHASQLPIPNANLQSSFQSRPMSSDPMYQVLQKKRVSIKSSYPAYQVLQKKRVSIFGIS